MTSLLLVAAAVPIAQEASRYFETVFRSREETFNFDIVGGRAAEMDATLADLAYKAHLLAAGFTQSEQIYWAHDRNFLGVEIRNAEDKKILRKWNEPLLKDVCQCEPGTVTESAELDRLKLVWEEDSQIDVQNMTVKNGLPMFTIAFPLKRGEDGRVAKSFVVYVSLSAIERPFLESRERTFYAVDHNGYLMGHSDAEQLDTRVKLSDLEAVRVAEKSRLPRGQKRIDNSISGARVYSAFAKTNYGVTLFSEVSEDIVLEPSREVRRKVIMIVGLTLSIALFVVFLFSITLTLPIEKLTKMARAYQKGKVLSLEKFRQQRRWIDDEVGSLTRIFEKMLIGLRERDLMKALFRKFHGSSVADRILRGNVNLTGVKKNAVVLFCDLRGFTSMAERTEPEKVFEMLNEYFGVMVDVISAHGGLVDKFVGDAILAVWGAPVPGDTDAKDAVRACLKMRLALARLNRRRMDRGEDPLYMGMSLNFGPLMSGTVGSNERMEFTVIGNTVNTASRLEGMTKYFGVDLLISESVQRQVASDFNIEYAGEAVLRGHSEPTKVFEVVGVKGFIGEMNDEVSTPYSRFEKTKQEEMEGDEIVKTLPSDLIEPMKEAQVIVNEKAGRYVDLHTTMRRIITAYIDSYLKNYHLQIRDALPAELVAQAKERDQNMCQALDEKGGKCGSTNMLHMHHLIRPSEGGQNISENLITLCYEHQREWAKRKLKKAA